MTVLDDVDQLYELAVMEPSTLNDQVIADWAEGVAAGSEMDRTGAKYVRRCLNISRKLSSFWIARAAASDAPSDWRARVDIALGIRAWRPQLDLAQHILESSPSEDVYSFVVELFRIVNNEPFLDGVSFEEWRETQQS
ncbi:MAG: hypothetical protein BMS9Abin12_0682 [Acidimicrobiia bacterium]|nr:MAG: hypothetical protein BMS9Abin12_0682 [Acidimicrobiia bacterium]